MPRVLRLYKEIKGVVYISKQNIKEVEVAKRVAHNRKTNEQFIDEVFNLVGDEYIFLEEYENAKTKIKCKHNKCGHEWDIPPNSFLRGTRCPSCANIKIGDNLRKSHEQYEKEFYDIAQGEYDLLSTYVRNSDKVKVRHNLCGRIYDVVAASFLKGVRCKKCQKEQAGINLRKSNEQVQKEVYDLVGDEYEFLEEYQTSNTPILIMHNL